MFSPLPQEDDRPLMLHRMLFLLALVVGLADSAMALPVFARRYETSCTTCHTMIPKLNPFGIAFRNNGYHIPLVDEKLLKTPDVSLGAPAWKQLWPKAVWPGKIPGIPPVAFRAALDVDLTPSQTVHTNFDFPNFVAVYFAGPAGDSLSFFADLFIIGSTNQLFIDRAWAQFRLTPEKPGDNWAVLKVGRIDPRVEPFSSTYRKTTEQNYNISTYSAFSDGFKLFNRDAGIELWGAATGSDNHGGLEYASGLVQGTAGAPENNNYKDPYWTASYKFGGHGLVGSRREPESEMAIRNYAEKSIEVGGFGYHGKDITHSTGSALEYEFNRSGGRVDAYYGNLNVYGAAVAGQDTLHDVSPRTINSSAFYVESDYMLEPWIMPVVRFEKTNFNDGRHDIRQVIPAVNFAVRANVRVLLEGHFFNRLTATSSARTGINEGLVRLEFLF